MERQRRLEKRKHQTNASSSGKYHRSENHGGHSVDQGRGYYDDATRIRSRPQIGNDKGPNHALEVPALSGDDDYVRRWLAQTDVEINEDMERFQKQQKASAITDHRSKYQTIQHDIRPFNRPPQAIAETNPRAEGERRHNSSSDSSLLEVTAKQKSHLFNRDVLESDKTEKNKCPATQPKKKRIITLSESETSDCSSSSVPREEVFEKRARHKTREERYKPKEKKSRNSGKAGEEKRSKTRREKRGDRKRSARKAGEELLNTFSSKNIGQERLTIRPSHGLGLFKNGRASSPARRRGIPDLAFSEMEFLQHANRQPSTSKEDKVTSKWREKEMRKTSRTQDEISTFFKPSKMSLQEMHAYEKAQMSESDDRPKYFRKVSEDNHKRSHRHPQSTSYPKKPLSGFGQVGTSSDRLSGRRGFTPGRQTAKLIPDTTSMLSGRATSCVSWSETQLSPITKGVSKTLKTTNRGHKSPTPDSIRRYLEKTGVFRETGIRTSPDLEYPMSGVHPKVDSDHQIQNSSDIRETGEDRQNRNETSKSISSPSQTRSSHSGSTNQDLITRVSNLNDHPSEQRKAEDIHCERPGKELQSLAGITRSSGKSQAMVEHFDSQLGWHSDPNSAQPQRHSPATQLNSGVILQESKRTPNSRRQIAKNARIKRRSTILPVTTIAKARDSLQRYKHRQVENESSRGTEVDEEDGNDEVLPQKSPETLTQMASSRPDENPSINPVCKPGSEQTQQKELVYGNQNVRDLESKSKYPDTATQDGPQAVAHSTTEVPVIEAARQAPDGLNLSDKEWLEIIQHASNSGTPLRQSWIGHGFQERIRPCRISPLIGTRPLYMHQMQQNEYRSDQRQVQHDVDGESGDDTDQQFFRPLSSEMVSCKEHSHYDITEEVDTGHPAVDVDSYTDWEVNEGYLGIKDDAGKYQAVPGAWQPGEDFVQEEMDNYEVWNSQPQNSYGYEQLVENMYAPDQIGELYVNDEQGNVYDYNGEDGNMGGFWRPHRQY